MGSDNAFEHAAIPASDLVETMTARVAVQHALDVLRDMRAFGSWDKATLDRASEIIGMLKRDLDAEAALSRKEGLEAVKPAFFWRWRSNFGRGWMPWAEGMAPDDSNASPEAKEHWKQHERQEVVASPASVQPVKGLEAALEEYEGYDKHGGVDDTLTAARLLAKALLSALSANLGEPGR
jgi:hypothetical protein